MNNYNEISKVTGLLKNRLQMVVDEIDPESKLTFVRPDRIDIEGGKRGINIFLYQVLPNPTLRNISYYKNPENEGDTPTHTRKIIPVDIYYLLTFFTHEGQQDIQHRSLEGTVCVMESYPTLDITYNTGDTDTLHSSLMSLDEKAISKFWSTLTYQLSIAYEITSVKLSLGETPLAQRVSDPAIHVTPSNPA